jgi:uncharacterized membrane protein YdfJ with MMPL/SSD domain
MRLLLVEDEPDVAETLSWGLATEGYVVDTADNGVDGLWKATENAYDVIVLDVMLPGLDGYQVCRRLRERGRWDPILLLTAMDDDLDRGSTAADMAFTSAVYGNFPLVLALITLLSLLILIWAFRSVVLAVKAVVLNLVSLGAAFGFMVLFWQQGHGSDLIYGIPATAAIRDWIPVVVFACLFGLSMDYEVFVLSRIREEYDRTGSTDQAVITGLARTGRLVTCAAVIVAVSFLTLSSTPNQLVRIVASALAVGILLDAVIVRTLLVPALISVMGRWNWWLPAPLARALRAAGPLAGAAIDGSDEATTRSG